MHALEICASLKKDLGDTIKRGEVHSVFDSSFNMILENGRLITVAHASRPINHYSVIVAFSQSFKLLGLRQGQKVCFSSTYFEIQDLGLKVNLKSAASWDSGPDLCFPPASIENLQEKSDSLVDFLVHEGHRQGIYPLLQYLLEDWPSISALFPQPMDLAEKETVIKDSFLQFMDLFSDYYALLISLKTPEKSHLPSTDDLLEEIDQAASSIIGFGFGLTPHMDDFLAGLMSAAIYGSIYEEKSMDRILSLNQAIFRESERLTTKVSHEMLLYCSEGRTNKALRDVLEHIFMGRRTSSLNYFFRKVNELGASSGTDTLLGVYMGLVILIQTLNS